MAEENELAAGSSFDIETGTQTVYGTVFAYGFLMTSASVILNPTGSLPNPAESVSGQMVNYQSSTTGSLWFFNGADYIKLNTNTNFNYAFSTDPSTVTFVTIPTGSNNERAFTFKYLLSSGSSAANIAQGQVIGDGSGVVQVNLFATSSAFGGVSPTITAAYNGDGINLQATFGGSNYIISGSYSSVI